MSECVCLCTRAIASAREMQTLFEWTQSVFSASLALSSPQHTSESEVRAGEKPSGGNVHGKTYRESSQSHEDVDGAVGDGWGNPRPRVLCVERSHCCVLRDKHPQEQDIPAACPRAHSLSPDHICSEAMGCEERI